MTLFFPRGDGAVAALMRSPHFALAGVGPVERWPDALRWAAQLMLDSRPATALLWGPERALLYNDAAAALMGRQHPVALGRPLRSAWPDLPDDIGGVLEAVLAGRPVGVGSARINMLKPAGVAEVMLAVSLTPLRDGTGACAGMIASAVETEVRIIAPAGAQTPAAPDDAAAGPRLTVLVVEDDALVLEAVTAQLTDAGHQVVPAGSSEEAVATLAAHSVDVLLTDLNLPGASGATLAATARRLRPEVGIVLATGDAREAAHVAVPHRLLPKPFTPGQLVAALADFVPLPPPEPTVWIADRGD